MKRFLADTQGNFAVTFALTLIPVILAGGMAFDYARIAQVRSGLQNAADSAALAGAIEITTKDSERIKAAQNSFNANAGEFSNITPHVEVTRDAVKVTVNARQNMSFMSLIGKSVVPIKVEAQSNLGNQKVEVALVLDVSGSMNAMMASGRTRIEELKLSAEKLVTDLKAVAGDRASFAIVPFTMNVNIGRSRTSWVWGNDKSYFNGTTWMGCVQERGSPNHIANNPGGKFHAYAWPPSPDDTTNGMCKNPSNGTLTGYGNLEEASAGTTFNAQFDGPNRNCVRHEIMPLEINQTTIENRIAQLTAEGNDGTIIAPGVTWGLRALSPEWPFEEGADWKSNTLKYMIVLTDGDQTTEIEYQSKTCNMATSTNEPYVFKPSDFGMAGSTISGHGPMDNWTPYGFIADSNPFNDGTSSITDLPASIDGLSIAACNEAKKANSGNAIEIFTIGVSDATAPGSRSHDLLRNCASKPDNHFYASDQQALASAFEEITRRVKNIRLTH